MAKTKSKTARPKARLPRGLRDVDAAEIRAVEAMLRTIARVYESYGFEPLATPAFEYTDALGKFLPDQDRPNAGVFSFQDEDEQWLSLRYDLTAPLARYVAQNYNDLPKPFRRYQSGLVWRNEKPGPGRYREFMQFDADTVGASSVAADAEMCMMAADTLEALGIPRRQYVIKVNSRKVLDGVLEEIGVTNEGQKLTILRALDKYDRLGAQGVKLLLGKGRKDESGDFTKGADLIPDRTDRLLDYLIPKFPLDMLLLKDGRMIRDDSKEADAISDDQIVAKCGSNRSTVKSLRGLFDCELYQSGLSELEEIADLSEAAGYSQLQICIDPSVVRGLEYYTGPVFEAELTFDSKTEEGTMARFGSVGGGGRYDGLIERFRGQRIPATGFSVGVSRLYAALQALGKIDQAATRGPVIVTVFDKARLADYQAMVQRLRAAGIRAELYLGQGKMGQQLKYADQRGAPCVVIQGEDERSKGEVQIKDLVEGAKAAGTIASNEEWRSERPAQFAVPEDRLVEAVRELLAGHGN